jgi:hypothetical protein
MGMKRKPNGQFEKGEHWRQHKPFREKGWLIEHYINQQMSTGEIATMFGVTDTAVLFWMKKHNIDRRSISQARGIKKWGVSGSDNPMWNKRGELNPRWLGGITPERQAFYTSRKWKIACSAVWKRDSATCQRCGIMKKENKDIPFHIHHVKSFSDKKIRAETSNLVLVCEICHHFIHSKRNKNCEYLQEE